MITISVFIFTAVMSFVAYRLGRSVGYHVGRGRGIQDVVYFFATSPDAEEKLAKYKQSIKRGAI